MIQREKFKRRFRVPFRVGSAYPGFTLIELTVAMTIFAILTLFVIDFYTNITRVYLGSLSARSAQQNLRVAMETFSRYLKQGRQIEKIEFDENGIAYDEIILKTKDDNDVVHTIRFFKQCEGDPYSRDDFSCGGVSRRIGIIRIDTDYGSPQSTLQPLTSTNLNITEFKIEPSPGIPLVLNITLKAQIEEAQGKGWERGAGGLGEIEMKTAIAMKGQYY